MIYQHSDSSPKGSLYINTNGHICYVPLTERNPNSLIHRKDSLHLLCISSSALQVTQSALPDGCAHTMFVLIKVCVGARGSSLPKYVSAPWGSLQHAKSLSTQHQRSVQTKLTGSLKKTWNIHITTIGFYFSTRVVKKKKEKKKKVHNNKWQNEQKWTKRQISFWLLHKVTWLKSYSLEWNLRLKRIWEAVLTVFLFFFLSFISTK